MSFNDTRKLKPTTPRELYLVEKANDVACSVEKVTQLQTTRRYLVRTLNQLANPPARKIVGKLITDVELAMVWGRVACNG